MTGWRPAGGLVDLHVHFMPERVLRKVWAFFDDAERHYGIAWPVHYRGTEAERLRTLAAQGVSTFAPLVYAHRPGMAQWLTEWAVDFGLRTPGAVPTATIWPEASVATYLAAALDAGARCAKVHVQVGGFDPRDPLLAPAWGLLAEAEVPVVVHWSHQSGQRSVRSARAKNEVLNHGMFMMKMPSSANPRITSSVTMRSRGAVGVARVSVVMR